jgi:hypothetical protein
MPQCANVSRYAQPRACAAMRNLLLRVPRLAPLGQQCGRQEMNVDESDALAMEPMSLDEPENLITFSDHLGGQVAKQFQDRRAS